MREPTTGYSIDGAGWKPLSQATMQELRNIATGRATIVSAEGQYGNELAPNFSRDYATILLRERGA